MRKELVAAAAALACALPALAQTSPEIQVYGRANVSYERITVSPGDDLWDLVDNSSRIGVRGKKDLGAGLTGFFQVESRVRLDEGGDTFSSRDSWLGVQGMFGTVRLGRSIGPVYYATYDYISMHNHDTGTSSDNFLAGGAVGQTGFMDNIIWYTSPKLGAFTFEAAFARLGVDPLAPGAPQPKYLGLVGSFSQGPLYAALAYATTKDSVDLDGVAGAPVVPNDDKVTTVTALYDFKSFVLGGLYEKAESNVLAGGKAKRDYFRVSGMVPVGKHEFHANFGWVDDRLDAILSDAGAKQWTLAYNYNITKEFKVFAFYTVVDNENNGNYGFETNTAGVDNKSIAVGARYNF